jgi:hypothetical protein
MPKSKKSLPKKDNVEGATAPSPRISAAEYHRILDGTELTGLCLNVIRAEVINRRKIHEDQTRLAPTLHFDGSFANIEVGGYTIAGVSQEVGIGFIDNDEVLASIFLSYQVEYRVTHQWTPEFFEVFKNGPLMVQVIPYAREMIFSTMQRLALPPYLLPLLRVPAPTGPGEESEPPQ